jgi:hypothetical protein
MSDSNNPQIMIKSLLVLRELRVIVVLNADGALKFQGRTPRGRRTSLEI